MHVIQKMQKLNVNEINEDIILSEGIYSLSGKKEIINIYINANSTVKLVLVDMVFNQLNITLNQDSSLYCDSILNITSSLLKNIYLGKNCYFEYKSISCEKMDEQLYVHLLEEQAKANIKYLNISHLFKSNIIQKVIHKAKNTYSNISNYGISLSNSEIKFETTGQILKGMSGSECRQLSRGIINGDNAAVISLPVLLIDEYDVKANHGASIGKMSDDELFYLMSRGLTKNQAYKLILSGIINPFINELIDESIKKKIENNIYNII